VGHEDHCVPVVLVEVLGDDFGCFVHVCDVGYIQAHPEAEPVTAAAGHTTNDSAGVKPNRVGMASTTTMVDGPP
jgi:hypothetical protein